MKKYIFILISLCISTFSAWSVWEGNGIAGATTDFQEDGMFVKSSLFPKYTLVEIVNLENDIKARAIVLEGKEVPGILMSFSPSVAEALKVQYGEVTRIRISSPSLTSDDVASSLYLPKEETAEKENLLAMNEKKEPMVKIEETKEESKKEKEVVLYDFNPIAKTSEKIDRKDGAISFDPAFIEEDVKLDLHIPETSIAPKKTEVVLVKKEEIKTPPPIKENAIPVKEVLVLPKTEKPLTTTMSPKTVSTPLKPIYLEDASLRPPKEVPPIVVLEKKQINDAPVRDVVMIEKKKKEEPRLFIKVDEVDPIKNASKEEPKEQAIVPVSEVRDVEKKPIETPQKPEKVQEATQIKTPIVEDKKQEIVGVSEVGIPEHVEEEKDIVLPNVIELPQVVHAPDEEKEIVPPVAIVGMPQKPEENPETEETKVPIVDVVTPLEAPIEEQPIEEEASNERSILEEPSKEEPVVEELIAEVLVQEEATEELPEEMEELVVVKELDEMPLDEVKLRNGIEEDAGKEMAMLTKESDVKALDETIPEKNIEEEAFVTETVQEVKERKDMLIEETQPVEEPEPVEESKAIEEPKPIVEEVIREKVILPPSKEETKQEMNNKPTAPMKKDYLKAETKETFSTGKTLKNSSYVQIAVYTSALAVEDLLKKYSGQYPITVEKGDDVAGARYIVFIGPLKRDELGAIQERFKSFGFQDCFLK
ncbi:MAG: hypothetical protein ACTTJ6_02505 [Treponema sp.]